MSHYRSNDSESIDVGRHFSNLLENKSIVRIIGETTVVTKNK